MRVEWATTCRYVEAHDNLATMVGAGFDIVSVPPDLPPDAAMAVMFAVRLAIDAPGQHEVNTQILAPDMQPIGEPLTAILDMPGPPHERPGWEGHAIVPMSVNIPVGNGPGVYTVVFSAAGGDPVQVSLIVKAVDVAPDG